MEIVQGEFTSPHSAAILPGSFHPPTVAHWGLAQAALRRVDQVIFTLPRAFPHKQYEGVALAERLLLLERLVAGEPRFSVAVSNGGLFIEMARELRDLHPGIRELFFVCGRDAAERIVGWPYPESEPMARQLGEYSLLVAPRDGWFQPPPELAPRIENLRPATAWDEVSSTEVRRALEDGRTWRHLVPSHIHELVAEFYSPSRLDSRNVRSR